MSFVIRAFDYIRIVCREDESEAVRLAVINLRRDLMRTMDCLTDTGAAVPYRVIQIGTVDVNPEIGQMAGADRLKDENGNYRKEAYVIRERDGELIIAGTDRRGTVYGIYEFCGMLGVSPWYFFADVPVKKREELLLEDGFCKADYPSVEYRGIFINDEEELEHWAVRYMGEETIGVKTYEKIFELLLRLKLNYLWPAMHVNSFNMKRENGALADRMGIVIGTSHCDMLMRSNNREWKPWIAAKGYDGAVYDYSIPGQNREILNEYWRESVEQNRDFEVCYTLGMRGIHDSGFETKTLEGLTGEALVRAKMDLLSAVIRAQEDILSKAGKSQAMKTFIPYKEVLELYDRGLEIPQDLTMVWVNDNFGYIRRYPGARERNRAAGNGIYYHNSYWAAPEGAASYLFITTIPLSQTRNELKKAWEEGIRKLWVTNFGAIKPLEEQLSYYAQLAWDVGKENPLSDHEEVFLAEWLDGMFSGGFGSKLAQALLSFDQLVNIRKLEHMDCGVFSQTAYGDEAAVRIHRLEQIFDLANDIWGKLPLQEKDAFFQLVLMKIHAAYYTNCMYYYADRSRLCEESGKHKPAAVYSGLCLAFDQARRRLLHYYNHVMSNGKWDGMVTPEDFPPPRTAMFPAYKPPLFVGDSYPVITVFNGDDALEFNRNTAKWVEIANAGEGSFSYRIEGPEWLRIENSRGRVGEKGESPEIRVLIRPDLELLTTLCGGAESDPAVENKCLHGELKIYCGEELSRVIPVCCRAGLLFAEPKLPVEDDGIIAVAAEDFLPESDPLEDAEMNAPGQRESGNGAYPAPGYSGRGSGFRGEAVPAGWKRIANLGRSEGALLEARMPGASLSYRLRFISSGSFLLEIHRYPSLDSVGRIRIGVSVDGGAVQEAETFSNDAQRGNWLDNVKNAVDRVCLRIRIDSPGIHTVTFHAMDRYFAFSRFAVYTRERAKNSLGAPDGDQRLPEIPDIKNLTERFYGPGEVPGRPMLCLPVIPEEDMTRMADIRILRGNPAYPSGNGCAEAVRGLSHLSSDCDRQGNRISPEKILSEGKSPFAMENGRVRIDAAAALAGSENAYYSGKGWDYCGSPSYDESGLAMMMREDPEHDASPSLHYRFAAGAGQYRLWILIFTQGMETAHFALGLDGEMIPEEALYRGKRIWSYSSCQVWKWVPAWEGGLSEGLHDLAVYPLGKGIRFDRIYLTEGEEYPPVDAAWSVPGSGS